MTNSGAFGRGNKRASKLTGEEVLEIRERYLTGRETYGRLAIEFGVSLNTVSNIIKGYTWREMAGPELVGRDRVPPQRQPRDPTADEITKSQERLSGILATGNGLARLEAEARKLDAMEEFEEKTNINEGDKR